MLRSQGQRSREGGGWVPPPMGMGSLRALPINHAQSIMHRFLQEQDHPRRVRNFPSFFRWLSMALLWLSPQPMEAFLGGSRPELHPGCTRMGCVRVNVLPGLLAKWGCLPFTVPCVGVFDARSGALLGLTLNNFWWVKICLAFWVCYSS